MKVLAQSQVSVTLQACEGFIALTVVTLRFWVPASPPHFTPSCPLLGALAAPTDGAQRAGSVSSGAIGGLVGRLLQSVCQTRAEPEKQLMGGPCHAEPCPLYKVGGLYGDTGNQRQVIRGRQVADGMSKWQARVELQRRLAARLW